jgi:predicted ATPase
MDLPNNHCIEALTIYYSLKQISNVLGYQIVDLNYPVLSRVVTSLNNLSVHIGLLQSCASYVTADIGQVYEGFNRLLNEYTMASDTIESISYLDNAVAELDNTMKSYYDNISNSADEFTSSKVTKSNLSFIVATVIRS